MQVSIGLVQMPHISGFKVFVSKTTSGLILSITIGSGLISFNSDLISVTTPLTVTTSPLISGFEVDAISSVPFLADKTFCWLFKTLDFLEYVLVFSSRLSFSLSEPEIECQFAVKNM